MPLLTELENLLLIALYTDVAPDGAIADLVRQRVGAFFLDVAQAVNAAFADEQNRQADP
jgi:hypothetical protein